MKRTFLLLLPLAAAFTARLTAGEVSITLPPETAAFKTGPGVELAQANCLICHSADYLRTQPPMPRKFWEATMKKMREKYFAPITDENAPKLIEYLVATYGSEPK
jgi:mono/diheme cytochrome c family protein